VVGGQFYHSHPDGGAGPHRIFNDWEIFEEGGSGAMTIGGVKILNTELLSNPVSWLVILSMLLIAGYGAHVIAAHWGGPATAAKENS
jgi:hypothetical protein